MPADKLHSQNINRLLNEKNLHVKNVITFFVINLEVCSDIFRLSIVYCRSR